MFNELLRSRAESKPLRLFLFYGQNFPVFALTDAEVPITKTVVIYGVSSSVVFQPWPVQSDNLVFSGEVEKETTTIKLALGTGIEDEFRGYPPDTIVNLVIWEGELDAPTDQYVAVWRGRILAPDESADLEIAFSCEPGDASLRKLGQRKRYQRTCGHVLYGPECRVSRPAFTSTRQATSFSGTTVVLNSGMPNPRIYRSGMMEWTIPGTTRTVTRTIAEISPDGRTLVLRGQLRGFVAGITVKISPGCNRTEGDCSGIFGNILNFGGCPFIPTQNPLSNENTFY